MKEPEPAVAVVVIGRNEGDRLRRCLESVAAEVRRLVYVDSGSTDGSVDTAREFGAEVLELDTSIPCSAARARNAGRRALAEAGCGAVFVQFIDGDCELESGWLEAGVSLLDAREDVAIVCGRLGEQAPHRSVYNRLCELEWRSAPGRTRSCGGICMVRLKAFDAVGGFREHMIAGEEPDLCRRLANAGWRIWRLAVPMAVHDAAMISFGQWWKRTVRGGHALAECAHLHRAAPDRPWRRERLSNWIWGVVLPGGAIALAWPTAGLSLAMFLVYPLMAARIAVRRRGRFGDSLSEAWLYATFCVLAKFPQALGQLLFHWRRWTAQHPRLIEYKLADGRAGAADARVRASASGPRP